MNDRLWVDFLNIGTVLISLSMMLFSYTKFRQQLLSPFLSFVVFTSNLHVVIFYCLVLYSRWFWNIDMGTFFQDWSGILRFLTVLFYGGFVFFVLQLCGKGGKFS